jgi:hypothetical protein
MTHITCPGCELRFAQAIAASLPSCPFCGGSLVPTEAQHLVGFQLVERVFPQTDMPHALSSALPVPPSPEPVDG